MKPNIKYCLRLRLKVRALKKEVKDLEALNGDPLARVQAIAKARALEQDIRDLKALEYMLSKKYDITWW